MLEDLASIGWRQTLIGIAVLVIASVAGWGMAGDRSFAPAHWLHWWIAHIILPGLRHPAWWRRMVVIFLNNASICALVIWAGRLPAGAWVTIVLMGLSLGTALRMLTDAQWGLPIMDDNAPAGPVPDGLPPPDRVAAFAVLVNLLELPAIGLTLGLSIGRRVLPNHLLTDQVWGLYAGWVIPLLLAAAAGEAVWLGRRRF